MWFVPLQKKQSIILISIACTLMFACQGTADFPAAATTSEEQELGLRLGRLERLGRLIFFDSRLSEPQGQSCATCHGPSVGFTGPSAKVNRGTVVYPGAIPTRFGNRKPPSAAYAPMAGLFAYDSASGAFTGGNFWDGRATGEKLGNPAADQAQGPFLNPLEQNNPDAATVVAKVCGGAYGSLFEAHWGAGVCADVPRAYDAIALSIAAFEASKEVSAFSSKYDAWKAGDATLTAAESRGLALFEGKAGCDACHMPPLFTDFSYDNLGVPRNPANPFYSELDVNPAGADWVDPGLAGFLATRPEWAALAAENLGKQKVPTLRNVDKRPRPGFTKAFTHNGIFKSLKAVVHFYNTRDVLPVCPVGGESGAGTSCWPAPEVPQNVNRTELGNLGLSSEEEDDVVAFLRTLSDGYCAGQSALDASEAGDDPSVDSEP
jgi:cytochrome c peroxidase